MLGVSARYARPSNFLPQTSPTKSSAEQFLMSHLALRPFVALFILGLINSEAALSAETARWDFQTDNSGWTPNGQVQLDVVNGTLTVTSTGNDPYLTGSVKAPAGWHKLTLAAKFAGKADFQVFWNTEKDNGTAEARSARAEFRGDANKFRSVKLFFHTNSPLTTLRIDPMSGVGKMQIESIVLTDDAPPQPTATPVADIRVPEGFKVELLHSVDAATHGSWVSMTPDHKGRLIVSDQYGKLHRVTVPAIDSEGPVLIEPIDLEIGMAQGLLYAFDSLYVMVNSTDAEKQGLYRITDSDGDDRFDTVEWLRKIDGGGEHGPHSVILSPDEKSLYVCAGNHTNPTEFSSSRVPKVWQEDQLLPRMWDAGGHAVGKMAPGGWIAKVSPDGKEWELVASGFRNEYDIAFSPEGELFTYDADMEWDVGTPWYRPTRVNHVTSGGEFGWRSGTGKWPSWYPDSLPSVVDIGPGSPTGIAFGTRAKFPAKYQRSLFISDWSYGIIYAVQLTPEGASWTGTAERFVSAAPLPGTDIIIAKDGAMYFTIGGRRTQSGLYRVTYAGVESTTAVTSAVSEGAELRALRTRLEMLHHPNAENAIATAWPHLGHSDRHIRFAARIAVEHRPIAEWADKALAEDSNANAKINALLALTRHSDASMQEDLLMSLAAVQSFDLSEDQLLATLRVLGLTFIRLGQPGEELKNNIASALSPLYPAESTRLNRELCALLVYLGDQTVAPKTLALMNIAPTQEEQMFYALCLRALKKNWTNETRTEYFNWFLTSTRMSGGNSFGGFLKNIRQEAIDGLSDEEKVSLKDVLAKSLQMADAVIEAASRPHVNEWKVDDLLSDIEANTADRNFRNGQEMFTITGCYKCHRFVGKGGIVGPDLTAVGRRFNARNMLESILEPSKVVSDQYEATVFVTDSGKQIVGRVVNLNQDALMVSENMLNPGKLTTILRGEVEEMFTSKTSMMPNGLLNNLTKEEIRDLIAYLRSGGDPKSDTFAAE